MTDVCKDIYLPFMHLSSMIMLVIVLFDIPTNIYIVLIDNQKNIYTVLIDNLKNIYIVLTDIPKKIIMHDIIY